MKNIFKFMGLALVAGSLLFTACKKDEPETNDTTPATPASSFKVTFGEASWEAAGTIFTYTTQQGSTLDQNYLILYGFKNANDATAMLGGSQATEAYVSGTLTTTPGSYTYQTSGGDVVSYTIPGDVVYYEGDENNEAGNYMRWQTISSTFIENITECDVTARKMSATFSVDQYDIENLINSGMTDYGEITKLNGTIDNYSWTWMEDAE